MVIVDERFGTGNKLVVVLRLKGSLGPNGENKVFNRKVNDLMGGGIRNILLDFKECPYVGGVGLGSLINTYSSIRKKQGKLKLMNLSDRVKGLLERTKLLMIFEVFDSEKEALESFGIE